MDTYSGYFKETMPNNYCFADYYQYRSREKDFTFSFRREADKLRKDLDIIIEVGSEESKNSAIKMKRIFKFHRESYKEVMFFWDKIESDLANLAVKNRERELSSVKQLKPNPFISYPQGRKHDREPEEDDTDDEYEADQTIIGGRNVSWIVNGLDIRKKLTEYQMERNLLKTKPEYYDVIFFNAKDKNSFLETLENDTVQQMLKDISEDEIETEDEQEIKSLITKIIVRDINKAKDTLQQYKNRNNSFGRVFALNFVEHMIKLIEGENLLLEPMSEETYIISVLGPILDQLFIKHKGNWRAKYGETCLKASAKGYNDQEYDNRRSPGKRIDAIIALKEEDEEFSVIEVSGPPLKSDWTHFKGDRMKIIKMMKSLMNRLAEICPNSDIRMLKLYAMQSYLNQLTIYEFRLKYAEVYTMVEVLKIPFPKSWKDMKQSYEIVTGLLKYERLLSVSSESIQDFLWCDDDDVNEKNKASQKMTTRTIYSSTKKKARTS
ncbi:17049_t:CDS:2 [Acaulospora morrowiae]|uniref:17049_t:CDS:1 n=1 Tax=Acaulospora morrowiae TaxID=94023 RepID=A0A9N9DMQ6_9GLOM|nr:17049_t:CDS:2 [Acaulospora morrowiae]